MPILNAVLACARYAIGFLLLLCAATALNVAIVFGWNYLSPDSFSQTVSLAVESVDTAGNAAGGSAGGSGGGDAPLRQAAN